MYFAYNSDKLPEKLLKNNQKLQNGSKYEYIRTFDFLKDVKTFSK